MRFSIGDRVFILSIQESGTVSDVYYLSNGPIAVEVIPDNQEKMKEQFKPLERIKTQEYNTPSASDDIVKLHTTEDDLRPILSPNPEWKEIWDKN